MPGLKTVSIIPYKFLPARLGGEKCAALFHEYFGQLVPVTCIGTSDNDLSQARHYKMLGLLGTSKLRYVNIFLYFKIRKVLRREQATHIMIEHPYFGWLALLLKWTMGLPMAVRSQNLEYRRSESIGRKWWKLLFYYERWVHRNADYNFFISEEDHISGVKEMNLDPKKSYTITYGIDEQRLPDEALMAESRRKIEQLHNILPGEQIFLFNGALYHSQNYDALQVILDHINPVLMANNIAYKIVVCGKGLPDFFNELRDYAGKNVIYAGFVDDVSLYYKASDIFLNPIIAGGGIKTKAVEGIATNCTVISTEIGAAGLKKDVCGDKLQVVADLDWPAFAQKLIEAIGRKSNTPDSFFDFYYWGNIAQKAKEILEQSLPA